jgi:serine protease Do
MPRRATLLIPVGVAAALLLLGTTGLQAEGEPAPSAGSEALLVDDDGIVDRLEIIGGGLIREGKVPKLKTLRQQLAKRAKCSLSLPVGEVPPPMQPRELYSRRSSGVLIVGMLGKRKKSSNYEVAGCSGFALTDDGIFVTNYHVVDDPLSEGMVVMTRDGVVWPATEVLAADKVSDIAIIRAAGAKFQPVPLAAGLAAPGSSVWAISHPDHNFFSLTAGMISRYFVASTEAGRTPQMAITADFGIGSSGGPIFTASGEVAGMVCATTSVYYTDTKAKVNDLQMVFKHCVPVSSIRALIETPQP